jgi:hypothetical protein
MTGIEVHGEFVAVGGVVEFAAPLVQLSHPKMRFSKIVHQVERLTQERLGRLNPARLQQSDGLPQCFPRSVALRGGLRRRPRRRPTIRGATAHQPSEQTDQHDIGRGKPGGSTTLPFAVHGSAVGSPFSASIAEVS